MCTPEFVTVPLDKGFAQYPLYFLRTLLCILLVTLQL